VQAKVLNLTQQHIVAADKDCWSSSYHISNHVNSRINK